MANKNTRRIRKKIDLAVKAKNPTVTVEVPVRDYHNYDDKPKLTTATFHVPLRGKDGVVSRSPRRNMQMKVLQNHGEHGGATLTVHEPINSAYPVVYPNHGYMQAAYRQPNRMKMAA